MTSRPDSLPGSSFDSRSTGAAGERPRPSSAFLLGDEGPFASELPGFRAREGQQRLARAVEELLDGDGTLLAEAGTGIGKTFAYLVPALLSGRKVVISTATRTLQDQIAQRDLPLVQRVLGTEVPVAVMKGLGNYLCRRRYREFLLGTEALRPAHAADLGLLARWIEETETGDVVELLGVSEKSPTLAHVVSSSDTRVGASCPYFEDCFVTQMKRDAEEARIVVVNHHLFFADLALRGAHPARVLPEYDAVVFDEAHQIEDTAALFFGTRVTSQQLDRLVRDVERALASTPLLSGGSTLALCKAVQLGARDWFSEVSRGARGRVALSGKRLEELAPRADGLETALAALAAYLKERARDRADDIALRERLDQLARRSSNLQTDIQAVARGSEGHVVWSEATGSSVALSSTPVDLSSKLRSELFERVPAVALLSATLATRGSATGVSRSAAEPSGSTIEGKSSGFGYARSRLGLDDELRTMELNIASPFDFERSALLYLPDDLPPPGASAFASQMAERAARLIEFTDGGAFVLTTSLASMKDTHARLTRLLPERRIWLQGEGSRSALLSGFRAHGRGVLVATSSFWEGVDVPGSALRLVVLEKIPFAVPTDPVFAARSQALEDAGRSAFSELAVPSAAITLKQGFGRLIRTSEDTGIVAIFDERIVRKGYGKRLLAALPPAARTSSLEEVQKRSAAWGWIARE